MRFSVFIVLFFCGITPGNANDTTFVLRYREHPVSVTILYPAEKSTGTILLLHGWNLPPVQWCAETDFCNLALSEGYALILPNFGKTTYHYETYPETIEKYKAWPTRKWIYDEFLIHLQKEFSLLIPGGNNFAAGLSTGGRGAAFFALEHPEIFRAAACLSADFDQTKIADEPINNGYYGAYNRFPKRWEGKDNIHNRAPEMKVPLFLAHGKKDQMCPWTQTQNYYNELKKINPETKSKIVVDDNAGHDYFFWGGLSEEIIAFFYKARQ